MNARNNRLDLMRLRNLAVQDAMAISVEDMAKEDAEDGVDGAEAAESLRLSMRETAARALREVKPVRNPGYIPLSARPRRRPSIEGLKAMVQDVFSRQPALGLAFREGRKQSDQDWESLYDDLVDMGAIEPDDDEN